MCLVEIEGIPKLQTSCSTPVRDGMVVHTRTEQVKHAQSAVVEFLLVNHPLDCPVCDKGGECPLQDITQGWGPGKSRVIDEKRHFQKPIELSPLVAIDRERCILCYRCVRFSQEVAEDEQLQLLERGDRTFVGTFDDRPYVAPFHGNITDLCPVGALTNYTYRFRARPWDIEQAGSVCTLCPSQCNVSFTVRDEQVKRVLGRDNAEVDDGWLCDRGRYGFEMFAAEERVDGPRLKAAARPGRTRSPRRPRACGGPRRKRGDRRRRLQRGGLPGPAASCARRSAPHIDSRPRAAPRARRWSGSPSPTLGPGPRHRRRRRDPRPRHRPAAQLADPRPAHPQGDPPQRRQARGRDRAPDRPRRRRRGGRPLRPGRRDPLPLRAGRGLRHGESAAIRNRRGPPRRREGRRRLGRADRPRGRGRRSRPARRRLRPRPRGQGTAPACSKSPRSPTPAACARGRLPPRRRPGANRNSSRPTEEIRAALESGELKSLILFGVDPLRDFPDTAAWEAALAPPPTTSSPSRCSRTRPPPRPTSSSRSRPTPRKTAPSPIPTAASSASALAPPRPGDIRPNWGVLAELSQPSATTPASPPSPPPSPPSPTRSPSTPASTTPTSAAAESAGRTAPPRRERLEPKGAGPLRTFCGIAPHDLGPRAPADFRERRGYRRPPTSLRHVPRPVGRPDHRAEPTPQVPGAAATRRAVDRRRRAPWLKNGDAVKVAQNGTSVRAQVLTIKERVARAFCFLIEGTADGNANALLNGGPVGVKIAKVGA